MTVEKITIHYTPPGFTILISTLILFSTVLADPAESTHNLRKLMSVDGSVCFSETPESAFPQILGGLIGQTEFNCVDYDSSGSGVLIGGTSSSVDICSIKYGGGSIVVAVSDNPQFGIFIFDKTNGLLLKSLYEFNPGTSAIQASRQAVAVAMDNNDKIYVVTSESNRVMVSIFQYSQEQTIINPTTYIYGNSGANLVAASATFAPDFSYMYFSGSSNGRIALTKVDLSSGFSLYTYYIDATGSSSQKLWSRTSFHSTLVIINQFGCAENLGSDQNDIALMYLSETIGLITAISSSWFFNMNTKTTCQDVKLTQSNEGYFVIHQSQNSINYYGKVTLTTGSSITLTRLQVNTGTSLMISRNALLSDSGNSLFYLGSLTKVNSQNYAQRQGFIMRYPQTSCLQTTPSTFSQSVSKQILFLLFGDLKNPSSVSNTPSVGSFEYRGYSDTIRSPLLNLDLQKLPSECMAMLPQGTISPPVIVSPQVYQVDDPPLEITFSDFTYDINCVDDMIWTYTSTLADLSPLPTFISFTQLSAGNGGKYVVSTSDDTVVGTYTIILRTDLSNFYQGQTTFDIQISPIPPPTPTPTPTPTTSPTSSPTSTPSDTPTPSPTVSPTSSPTATPMPTDSPTSSPTPTPTPTDSPTSTPSPTPTPTPTVTQTPSPSNVPRQPPRFEDTLEEVIEIYAGEILNYWLPTFTVPFGNTVELTIVQQPNLELPPFITYSGRRLKVEPQSNHVGTYPLIVKLEDMDSGETSESQYLIILKVLKKESFRRTAKLPPIQPDPDNQTDPAPDIEELINIEEIGMNGEVKLSFSQEFFEKFQMEDLRKLISLESTSDSGNGENKIEGWEIQETTNTSAIIKLQFTDQNVVSAFQDPDILNIQFGNLTSGHLKAIQKIIPIQMPTNLYATDFIEEALYNAIQAVLYGSLGSSMIFGTSLSIMWGMINTLQLISHTPLFKIPFSASILLFLKSLFMLITFDPIETNSYLEVIFDLQDEEEYPPYNANFEFLGYESSNFIYLLGTPIFGIFIYAFLIILYIVLQRVKAAKLSKFVERLGTFLFFSSVFRFFIEIALEANFASIINFTDIQVFTVGDVISLILSILFFGVSIFFTIFIPLMLMKIRKEEPQDGDRSNYFQELIENLRLDKFMSIFYHSAFIIRRLIFVLIVFVFQDNLTFQIQIFVMCNLFHLIYLIYFEPISEDFEYEIFNEVTTLVLSYFMFIYTDFISSPQIKFDAGKTFIWIFQANIFINIVVIIKRFFVEVWRRFYRCWRLRKHRQRLKETKIHPRDQIVTKEKISEQLRASRFNQNFDLQIISEEEVDFEKLDEEDDYMVNNMSTQRAMMQSMRGLSFKSKGISSMEEQRLDQIPSQRDSDTLMPRVRVSVNSITTLVSGLTPPEQNNANFQVPHQSSTNSNFIYSQQDNSILSNNQHHFRRMSSDNLTSFIRRMPPRARFSTTLVHIDNLIEEKKSEESEEDEEPRINKKQLYYRNLLKPNFSQQNNNFVSNISPQNAVTLQIPNVQGSSFGNDRSGNTSQIYENDSSLASSFTQTKQHGFFTENATDPITPHMNFYQSTSPNNGLLPIPVLRHNFSESFSNSGQGQIEAPLKRKANQQQKFRLNNNINH